MHEENKGKKDIFGEQYDKEKGENALKKYTRYTIPSNFLLQLYAIHMYPPTHIYSMLILYLFPILIKIISYRIFCKRKKVFNSVDVTDYYIRALAVLVFVTNCYFVEEIFRFRNQMNQRNSLFS